MANKAFYVTREETEGQPAGEATLNRADKPQLLKIVPVDNAGKPNPSAEPENNQIYATEEENQEILFTSDTVQEGDYNPVTSDAVFKYAKPPHPDWANAVAITVAQVIAGYTVPEDGMVVGVCGVAANGGETSITINNVVVAHSRHILADYYNDNSLNIVVNKGDIIKCNGATQLSLFDTSFIPWK